MKTIKINLLVAVVFMLGTLSNYANVEIALKNTKAVKVVFENVEKNHSLTITDKEGVILHRENISKNGHLEKLFDLSSLKDGQYKIEVDKNFEVLIKNFTIKNKAVILDENTGKIVFKPIIKNKDNNVLISRINFDKKPLHISIYYKDMLILEETIKSDKTLLNKVYQLDETKKGNYTIIVTGNSKSTVEEFSL